MDPLADQALTLFTEYPGSMVYHFIVLFSIQAVLGMALFSRHETQMRRMAVAAAGILLIRLGLAVANLLGFTSLTLQSYAFLPPLERAVDAISLWLIIWSVLPLFNQLPTLSRRVGISVTVLLIAIYIVFAWWWYQSGASLTAAQGYNSSLQHSLWEAVQIGLLFAAFLHLLSSREGDWMLTLCMFVVLLGAHALAIRFSDPLKDTLGWVRLGQAAAYPAFAVIAFRRSAREWSAAYGSDGTSYQTLFKSYATIRDREEASRLALVNAREDLARSQDRIAELAATVDVVPSQVMELQVVVDAQNRSIDTLEKEKQQLSNDLQRTEDDIENLKQDKQAGAAQRLLEELRRPVSAIIGYSDLLIGGTLGAVNDLQRPFLERVRASSIRLRDTLNDWQMDDEALIETDRWELVNVVELAQSVVTDFSRRAAERNIGLKMAQERDLSLVRVDPEAVRQILNHLVSNAIEVSQVSEDVGLAVRLLTGGADDSDSGYLYLTVADRGSGIPMVMQPRIFDRTERLRRAEIEGIADGGIGLPLVHELAAAHGGRVWVESAPGHGATYSVVLPIRIMISRDEHKEDNP